MVKLDVVRSLNASLIKTQPLVAVFFGGTGGIGHQTLRSLSVASANGGKGFRAYVVGRNTKAADDIIAECRGIYPQGQFKFVKVNDLSLIQDVDRACTEIIELEEKEADNPRIDYLMLSQGGSIFLPRIDTKEGLDVTMGLMYYSRMRAITTLLPLLLKSTFPAKVVSVYAAGVEAKLFPEDLSLRDPNHYSYAQARSHMVYMHTLMLEILAEKHPGKLALVHIFPGLVPGPAFKSPELPLWFRIIFNWILMPIFGYWAMRPENCGQRMLSLASSRYPPRSIDSSATLQDAVMGTDGKLGSGAYSLYWDGESNNITKAYQKINKEDMKTKVWDHTMKAFEVIESGNVFKD